MLVVHGASRPSEILQDRCLAKLMACRRISFFICYITFKTRISFKENMKRGAHLLQVGPAGVKGRFLREIMLLLDGISVGGQTTREGERVHPCNVCDKAFKSLQMPSQHKIWRHSANVFACKGCGKKFHPNNSINRHNRLVCGKPHHRKSFCHFSMWARTTIEEIILNLNVRGEEERKRTVLASSRKRAGILYPLKWKYIVLVFNKFV